MSLVINSMGNAIPSNIESLMIICRSFDGHPNLKKIELEQNSYSSDVEVDLTPIKAAFPRYFD